MKVLQHNELNNVAGGWGIDRAIEDLGIHTVAGACIGALTAQRYLGSDIDTFGYWAGAVIGYFMVSTLDTWDFNNFFQGINEREYLFRTMI